MRKLLLLFFIASLIGSCQVNRSIDTSPDFRDGKVEEILTRAFSKAGGWDRWQSLSSISYKKRSILFLENGEIESDITQFHEYRLKPELSASIFWRKNGERHSITIKDNQANKYLNGELVTENDPGTYKSFLSAYYVLFMPFKLADEGVILSYEGVETLEEGSKVDVIKATYAPDQHENHSTADIWYYFFDVEDGSYLASMVYHEPTYAFINNTVINTELPLTMNMYRESFRVDEKRNKKFLRGEFYYSDYIMSFSDR